MESKNTRKEVIHMCHKLGLDSTLVQGAGGNVSWKDGGTLWIKASGTWLSDAQTKEIFVPTDLNKIKNAINANNYDIRPIACNNSKLKPSIETLLHAMMPHKIVVHLHAIDVLSYLILHDCENSLRKKLPDNYKYEFVPYFKPGAKLAEGVARAINKNFDLDVIFLINHGIFIGAEKSHIVLEILFDILNSIKKRQQNNLIVPTNKDQLDKSDSFKEFGYSITNLDELNNLSLNASLVDLVANKWALFPDHIVFLGKNAWVGDSEYLLSKVANNSSLLPPYIFCTDIGTLQHIDCTRAQTDQLQCYYDVVTRLEEFDKVSTLTMNSVNELLDWDAEKYRLSISK